MGFFSSLIKVVGSVGRAIIGLPPKATVAATAAAVTAAPAPLSIGGAAANIARTLFTGAKTAAGTTAGRIAIPVVAGGVGLAAGAALAPEAAALSAGGVSIGGGIGRGNGQFVKQTVVQTILVATGQVVRQEVFAGAPFAMQKDINRIRTLDRKLTRAANRVRSKSRGPSKQKQLTDAVVDTALRGVITACPPKC